MTQRRCTVEEKIANRVPLYIARLPPFKRCLSRSASPCPVATGSPFGISVIPLTSRSARQEAGAVHLAIYWRFRNFWFQITMAKH